MLLIGCPESFGRDQQPRMFGGPGTGSGRLAVAVAAVSLLGAARAAEQSSVWIVLELLSPVHTAAPRSAKEQLIWACEKVLRF